MAKKLFSELDVHKKDMITEVILNEFAEKSYSEASTNSIVKNAGISKGSLFKYFEKKEDMYFYIIDYIMSAFTNDIKGEITSLPQDIFERTIKYAEIEFGWYVKNPVKYKLLKKAFDKNDSEIYKKNEQRYLIQGETLYYKLFDSVDFSEYSTPKDKLLNVLKWFLEGFNKEFMDKLQSKESIEGIKTKYISELNGYINILKNGLK